LPNPPEIFQIQGEANLVIRIRLTNSEKRELVHLSASF
jgi:hypothetical protein